MVNLMRHGLANPKGGKETAFKNPLFLSSCLSTAKPLKWKPSKKKKKFFPINSMFNIFILDIIINFLAS